MPVALAVLVRRPYPVSDVKMALLSQVPLYRYLHVVVSYFYQFAPSTLAVRHRTGPTTCALIDLYAVLIKSPGVMVFNVACAHSSLDCREDIS